jgi:hypothetical protein
VAGDKRHIGIGGARGPGRTRRRGCFWGIHKALTSKARLLR